MTNQKPAETVECPACLKQVSAVDFHVCKPDEPAAGPPRVIRIYNPQLDRIKSGQNNSVGVHRPPFKHYELDPSYWDNFTEFVEAAYADELKRELEKHRWRQVGAQVDPTPEAYAVLEEERDQARALCEKLAGALESARDWVSTHAMQTYSRVARKEVEEIDELLAAYREWLKGGSDAQE